MIHIAFTGTRDGMTAEQRVTILQMLKVIRKVPTTIHHGDCIGADAEFHELAIYYGIPVHIHPPDVRSSRAMCKGYTTIYPQMPYLDRDRAMVDVSEFVIATPKRGPKTGGTWYTIRHAAKTGKPFFIVQHDGQILETLP